MARWLSHPYAIFNKYIKEKNISFPLGLIKGYGIKFPVLYSRIFFTILYIIVCICVFHCYITNYHTQELLKWYRFIISLFPWVMSGHWLVGSSVQDLIRGKSRCQSVGLPMNPSEAWASSAKLPDYYQVSFSYGCRTDSPQLPEATHCSLPCGPLHSSLFETNPGELPYSLTVKIPHFFHCHGPEFSLWLGN